MRRVLALGPLATAAVVLAAMSAFAAVAKQGGNGSITVTVYGCPPGVEAEAASPEACDVLDSGFGVRIYSLEGVAPPLTLDDAEAGSDGAFVWGNLIAGPGGTGYGVALDPLPDGAAAFVVHGDVDSPPAAQGTAWPVTLTASAPDAAVAVYALASNGNGVTQEVEVVPYGAALHAGDCGDLGEWVTSLEEVAVPDGPQVGDPAAIPVAQGAVTVDVPLDEAIDEGYAVAVYETTTEGAPVIACGEVGGADDDDGALAVGLREVGNSTVAGVAYLAYNADDPARTDVSLFLAEGLAADTGTPEAD